MNTPDRQQAWAGAFADLSGAAFKAIVADDVTLTGSVFNAPIEGADTAWKTLRTAASIYDDLEFTDFYDASDRLFLEWQGHALGHDIAGITVLRTRGDGAIVEVRIHHRPLPAVLAFAAELDRRLTTARTRSKDQHLCP
jgi:hypothetical protein